MASDKGSTDDLQQELRTTISDAYAFIEGQKATQSFTAVTFEDLMDQQIERLVGKDTEDRPNVLHRIERNEQRIAKAVEQIKKLPPDFFKAQETNQNVNTPTEDPDDE